jgi:hypothetical protein
MWNMRFRLVVLICGAAGVALALAPPCPAQMAQCSGVASGTDYKVLVDEVEYATGSGDQPALSIELIQNSVEGALEKVRRGILKGAVPQANIQYLNCKGRHPQDTSQFDNSLVRTMAANHAILELWGTLFPLGGGQHKFDIHYVMFPVASRTAPPPSGIAATEKTMASKPTPQEVKGYLIDARADLPTYFTVAAGAQAYADRNWDQAVRFLCEARTRLKKKANQQDLMNFADQLASKAAAEVRKSNNTAAGLLTDAQAKDYCMFATTR